MNLATRLFLLIATLIVLAVGSAIGSTWWLGREAARSGSEAALDASQSVQRFFQERSLRELELLASTMVSGSAFVSYISQAIRADGDVDERSIRDLLEERGAEYGFDAAFVLDFDGRLLAGSGDIDFAAIERAARRLATESVETFQPRSAVRVTPDSVLELASALMIRGRTLEGVVLIAKRIPDSQVIQVAQVSSTDLAYLSRDVDPPVIAGTTLDASRAASLVDVLGADRARLDRIAAPTRLDVSLDGNPWAIVVSPIAAGTGDGLLVSLVPEERLFAMFRRLGTLLLASGVGALVLALVASVVATRRFIRPIRTLTRTAEGAVKGEYPNRIEAHGKGELRSLERAFNRLVVELREQQAIETFLRDLWHRRSLHRALQSPGAPGAGSSATDPHRIGSVIGGRYELLQVVGKGGMGVVYEAHDRELDEVVALKMLKPALVNDPANVERLKTEIRLARRITHPNVVRTYDFIQVDGQAMISMEYMRGATLRQAIDDGGRLNYYAAMRLARQICSGIAAAHRAGVLHRDIKPGNIIINYSAKVMDFGIANPATRPYTGGHEEGALEGTPEFMSPEQIAGKDTDERSDIYSLGVVLMEMFTGRLPFQEQDTRETIVAHFRKEPHRPSEYWSEIPQALEAAILRCLEKSPRNRFQGVDDLLDALVELTSA